MTQFLDTGLLPSFSLEVQQAVLSAGLFIVEDIQFHFADNTVSS